MNFWCCCCRFTDGSQQNLFIGSCSISRGKRRSTSRLYLVNFYKFYGEIGVIFWFFQMKIFTIYLPIIKVPEISSRDVSGLLKNVKPFWHISHVRVFQNSKMHKIGLKKSFSQKSSKIWYSRIETKNFVYLARWRGQLMSALTGHCLPY